MRKVLLFGLFAAILVTGCNNNSAPPPITVSVGPPTATVQAGGTQQLTATVSNDPNNKGVTWAMSGTGCAGAACGTLSSTTADPVMYTAPANPPASNMTVTITATSVADTSKSGSATVTVPAIAVSVAPAAQTVLAGNSQSFTATAQNTSNGAVTWKLTQGGAACSPGCGSLSSTTANPVTYTAPGPPASNLSVTLTATSAADNTKSGSATITVPAITVSVAPPSANVAAKGAQNFTATVGNDAGNKGVTWTLTQGGTLCSPGCGTITPATASGSPATYTAPATVPANPNVTVTATSVSDSTKSATATATVVGISVSVSPMTASVVVNANQAFTATVANDVSNSGVTWTLTQGGVACAPAACGTVAPASTASGAPTTYTAPASPTTVTITATSVADPTKSASATITVTAAPPISVSIAPTNPTVTVNANQPFTATVTNDPANKGVTWTLTQSGTACSPGCGTLSNVTTTSVTYTAPASPPTPATVTITATSVADATKSASTTITVTATPPCGAGSENKLNGQYAFLLQGFDGNGPVAIAGSFTADGSGNITAGQEDVNRNVAGGVTNPQITPAGSSYSVGPDNRGCLTLVTGAITSSYRFSLGAFSGAPSVAAKGHIVSFDATGTNVAGVFEKQDPAAFSNTAFSGSFAFGASSPIVRGGAAGRFAVAGRFDASGGGSITNAEADTDDNGTPMHIPSFVGPNTYNVDGTTGRGTLTLKPLAGVTVDASFYVVSASEALLVSTDPQTTNSLFAGSALKQSGGPFGQGSLSAPAILSTEGSGSSAGTSDVSVGILSPSGPGAFTLTIDENNAGTVSTTTIAGTYTVAGNGRVTVTGGTNPPVIYLVSANKGLLVGTDTSVLAGSFEPQSGGPFTNASVSGKYAFGDVSPTVTGSLSAGVATADGAFPTGTISGTSDNNSSGTLSGGQTFSDTYVVAPSGRTTTGSGNNLLYIVSGTKAVLMSTKAGKVNSTITQVEK